jgi:ribosome-associated toxin RatA of RatAB toxin-antitoxin module
MIRCLLAALAVVMISLTEGHAGCSVEFPDDLGRVVDTGAGYRVRLIEAAGGGPKTAQARFLVRASRTAVWKAINDFAHYPEFMPNIKTSSFVKAKPGSAEWAFSLKAALFTVDYTLDMKGVTTPDSVWTLSWEYVKGDLNSTTGSWRLSECKGKPGSTLICYQVRVEVGRFVPDWISNRMTTKSIPELIQAVKTRAGEGR